MIWKQLRLYWFRVQYRLCGMLWNSSSLVSCSGTENVMEQYGGCTFLHCGIYLHIRSNKKVDMDRLNEHLSD